MWKLLNLAGDRLLEWIVDNLPALIIIFVVAISLAFALVIYQESTNTCLKRGKPVTTMIWNGKMMIPITSRPCILRESEVEHYGEE